MSASVNDIYVVEVNKTGLPGDGATVAEVAAWRAERADWISTLTGYGLDDLSDVDTTGAADGHPLVYDAGTASWVAGDLQAGYIAQVIEAGDPSTAQNEIQQVAVGNGLTVVPNGTGSALIIPEYAGSGVEDKPARWDHTHTLVSPKRVAITPAGYLSSGSRALASTTVTLAGGLQHIVKARLAHFQVRGADPGACYYTVSLTINGNTRTSAGGPNGYWAVQGVPREQGWEHEQTITGTGAAITVSASIKYHSGGGINTDAGELVVELVAAR